MTEFEQDLRERFRSLEDSVSPPPDLWDEIERRAAKRGPSPALGAIAAAVVLVVGLALVALAMRGGGAGHKVVASNGAADEPCGRPLPKSSEPDSPDIHPPTLGGPAPSALTGAAAQSSFSLDDGAFVVKPPRAGDDPAVSRSDAECVALTSAPRDGLTLLSPRMVGTPAVAIGYGRVTIAADVKPMQMDVRRSADAPPTVPPSPPSYQDRLAWIVVVPDVRASSCPAQAASGPTQAVRSDTTVDNYRVLLLDARTGGRATVYTEGTGGGCGTQVRNPPTVDVPVQRIAVPWKLGTRDKHNYTATISAEVLPCDVYDTGYFVGIDPYGPTAVVVQRPVDAHCGAAKSVQFTLRATDVLPATIEHAPLGPYIEPEHYGPPPSNQGPESVMIFPQDNGKTFTVKVGTVLEMPTMDYAHPHPVHSSDPDVVGDIGPPGDTSNISTFRAWRAGEVDLTLADGWKVHVVVQ